MEKKRSAILSSEGSSLKRPREGESKTSLLLAYPHERIAPIRLFQTKAPNGEQAKSQAPGSDLCMTLRQVLGFDGNVHNASIEWLVIANYLLDPEFLLQEVPELLSIGCSVVFYGLADAPITEWKEAVGDAVEFRCLKPSEPPGSMNPTRYKIPFGVHHTKMFLIGFSNKTIRVVVHTANMRYSDIHLKAQTLYLQDFPLKPAKSGLSNNEMTCEFETSLLDYLDTYHYTEPRTWGPGEEPDFLRSVIRRYDFRSARAVLIPSTPGYHRLDSKEPKGHLKLRQAIAHHTVVDTTDSSIKPIICQFSSIGSLSENFLRQLESSMDIRRARQALPTTTTDKFALQTKFVYPTVQEIRESIEGYRGGGSVPGTLKNVSKPFLRPLLHRWKPSAGVPQNPLWKPNNVPHIKTYFQLSKDKESLEYFVLGSQNLSMAAWGTVQNDSRSGGRRLFIRHWELGVFICPRLLGCEKLVPWRPNVVDLLQDICMVPLPFCHSPDSYSAADKPWAVDVHYSEPDSFGRLSV